MWKRASNEFKQECKADVQNLKYATINIQTRPGQSGSLIFSLQSGAIIGLLIGTYAPSSGVVIAGINTHELNQTSYCISANYIKEMLW